MSTTAELLEGTTAEETMSTQSHPLQRIAPLVLGGAGFSYQLHSNPESLPITSIITKAFSSGVRAIDTSPYYEPSEQLLGAVLNSPAITSKYQRSDYILMTKAGRISADEFNYSPTWIRHSVARSLQRFQTTYLDVVFCHDIEFVSVDEAIAAAGALIDLTRTGAVRHVGISGYDIPRLVAVARGIRARYGRPVDVVQSWAQLTLQNTALEQRGFGALRDAGVRAVCCSSPLAVGLLRREGVPVGKLGNWHPAPPELRARAAAAAEWVEGEGELLSAVALRFAAAKAQAESGRALLVTTITGVSTMGELEENIETVRRVFGGKGEDGEGIMGAGGVLDQEVLARDRRLCERVREILGTWVDFDFSQPPGPSKL